MSYCRFTVSRTRKQEGVFGGLDTREIVQDGYFADMKNMSSDYYPAAGPREARGAVIKILEKPNGLYWKNGLAYVDGTKLYYNDQEKGEVTPLNVTAMCLHWGKNGCKTGQLARVVFLNQKIHGVAA